MQYGSQAFVPATCCGSLGVQILIGTSQAHLFRFEVMVKRSRGSKLYTELDFDKLRGGT